MRELRVNPGIRAHVEEVPAITESTATFDLTRFTGYLLRRAFVRAAGCLEAVMSDEAHIRELVVVSILAERGAMSQRDLGELMHVNRSVMVKLVDSLEAKGWVLRDRNPSDRRSYALGLTPAGERLVAGFQAELDAGELALTRMLTEAEHAELNRLLRRLLGDDTAAGVDVLARRSGYLIAHAHRQLRDWAREGLGHLGLHPRDFGLLAALGRHQPCSQNRLAEGLGVSPPAVLAFVDDLVGRDLVSRVRNADDRRSYDVTLTPAGSDCLAKAMQAAAQLQALTVARLGVDGDAELRRILNKLVAP